MAGQNRTTPAKSGHGESWKVVSGERRDLSGSGHFRTFPDTGGAPLAERGAGVYIDFTHRLLSSEVFS